MLTAAPDLSRLLVSTAYLRLLVTSRAPLRLRGEQEFSVSPLALPEPSDSPPVESLAHVPAIALFVARARDIQPDFAVTTDETASTVAAICRRLDGLPPAIELVAARVKVLRPSALLARLEHRLLLLAGGPRDAPARQQTLRQTIAWSYDLLTPHEQILFVASRCSWAAGRLRRQKPYAPTVTSSRQMSLTRLIWMCSTDSPAFLIRA